MCASYALDECVFIRDRKTQFLISSGANAPYAQWLTTPLMVLVWKPAFTYQAISNPYVILMIKEKVLVFL